MEGCRKVCCHGPADLRPVGGPPRAIRHFHEQLHRTHRDLGDDRRCDQTAHENLCRLSSSQTADRGILRPDYSAAVPTASVYPRATRQGGIHDTNPHWKLIDSPRVRDCLFPGAVVLTTDGFAALTSNARGVREWRLRVWQALF